MFSERSIDTDKSIIIGKKFLKNNNLTYSIKKYGNSINSYTVSLDYKDINGLTILGNGKGLNKQSLASAIFEAIEHYLLDVTYYDESIFRKMTFKDLKEYIPLKSHYALNQLINNFEDSEIDCIKFDCVDKIEGHIYYPKFLMYPNYSIDSNIPNKYSVYSTNNGMAVGVSKEETLLHGFLEVIERNALSLHYLKHFISNKEEQLYIVKNTDINRSNKLILEELKSIFDKILVLNITSSNNIPSILVVGYNNNYKYPFVGSGSSLSKDYAIERALTESLQAFHLYGDDILMENIIIEENLKKIPNLIDIIYYNYGEIEVQERGLVDYNVESLNLSEQLNLLKKLIGLDGDRLYYNILYNSGGVFFSKCIIPTYEQFHLIRSGNIVMPSERGMDYLKEQVWFM